MNANELEDLGCDLSVYSDLHKDCYGFRPRSFNFATVAEFDAEFRYLADVELPRVMAADRAREAACVVKLEAAIAATMATVQGCDREQAFRYLMDAEGCEGDAEHFEYLSGVPFGYCNRHRWFAPE